MCFHSYLHRIILSATLALLIVSAALSEDFSFIHVSDSHSGAGGGTAASVANMLSLNSVFLEPYNVTALKPSFVIDTGDMTEFGPVDGAYDNLLRMYSAGNLKRYPSLGNHDGAWRSLSPEITREFGAPYYSFDEYNCHFVVLNSAGIQDPSPMFGPEQFEWLKSDLKKTGKKTPVFLAFHHPLGGSEYSGSYQMDQLVDILRPYNIVLIMVGHGHSAVYSKYDGFDMVQGGSSYGPGAPGFNVVSVLDGKLRVAYKETAASNATVPLLEKPFATTAATYPDIKILSPKELGTYETSIPLKVRIGSTPNEITACQVDLDGKKALELKGTLNGGYEGGLDCTSLMPGAHFIKFQFTDSKGAVYHRSRIFYIKNDSVKVLWRKYTKSASRSMPVYDTGKVFIGTFDGRLMAYNASSGRLLWTFKTGYAITGNALVVGDKVLTGSSDGNLYCLDKSKGRLLWKFTADDPIFSSPVTDGTNVYFGSSTGAFYSVSLSTGRLNWKNNSATYNIEIKPFISEGKVYYGAWDRYLYCVNTSDGSLAWKCVGKGSSEGGAQRYYSPADCGPVVCKGKVFVADRKYCLSIVDTTNGDIIKSITGVSAVSLSADGASVYLRGTNGKLSKVDSDGNVIWSTDLSMDSAPVSPVESNREVNVCSKKGLFSSVSADTGHIIRQYKVTPGSFVLSPVGASDEAIFLYGTDGMLIILGR